MKPVRVMVAISIFALCAAGWARAETYRVGPGEKFATISEVAYRLAPGDIVEVTGDISDSVTLTRSGSETRPITIRGAARTKARAVARPSLSLAKANWVVLSCQGGWYVIENLDFDGRTGGAEGRGVGLRHDCDNLMIRNCRFHHFSWKGVTGTTKSRSIAIEFCEFDSCGSIDSNGRSVDVWSWTPGAVARIEHCWFHDAVGIAHLRTHCPRNVIRYNWFEGSVDRELSLIDRIGDITRERPDNVYPMHSDIVGNVFIQGAGPGMQWSIFALGGCGQDSPGTEGDFNIAHNLFVMNRYAFTPVDPPVFVQVRGNVDHVRMYNNAFLQLGGSGNLVYLREEGWDTPETSEFIRRRGSAEPIVEGSNNWVFQRSGGIPATFKNTLRALNPGLVDLLGGDFRPRKDSPLAGAGLWPLPKGQVVDLVPEYEPQRGIPADLKAKPRRKATPPSIGPFEAAE